MTEIPLLETRLREKAREEHKKHVASMKADIKKLFSVALYQKCPTLILRSSLFNESGAMYPGNSLQTILQDAPSADRIIDALCAWYYLQTVETEERKQIDSFLTRHQKLQQELDMLRQYDPTHEIQ